MSQSKSSAVRSGWMVGITMLAASPGVMLMGEKQAVVKDAWGREVTVHGYDDAKLPGSVWFVHDPARPQPPLADEADLNPTLGAPAPEGAIILFEGKDLSQWTGGDWRLEEDYMEARDGDIKTKEPFGSCEIHLEWMAPKEISGEGQARGNSGVIIMGTYEVQVLDSWQNATYADGMAGAVYGQNPPAFNAVREPGQWNSYDITFDAPEFDEQGQVKRPARVTVVLNGITVQDDFEIVGAVAHRSAAAYHAHEPKLPLTLQDHHNPVRYRNVWVRPRERK